MTQRRNRTYSSGHYRTTSRRVNDSTLGTHVTRRASSSRHTNADSVDFSNARRSRRATRGYVEAVIPQTSSRESGRRYSRRMNQRGYAQTVQRRSRAQSITKIVICCIVALCVAGAVGLGAFFASVGSKLALSDSDVKSALVEADGDAFYVVVAVDLDTASMGNAVDGPEAIALVRVDTSTASVSVISFPYTTQTTLSDGTECDLRELAAEEGDAALVEAIAELAGVEVSHYVETGAEELVALVDALGGLTVEVPEEVDDPTAGDEYLLAGTQTLDGESVLTLLRATNYEDGIETQCEAQRAVLVALSLLVIEATSSDFLVALDEIGDLFDTDMGVFAVRSLVKSLAEITADDVQGAIAPGSTVSSGDDEEQYYVVSTSSLETLIAAAEAGEDLSSADAVELVDADSFTITVRNGSGVDGVASQVASTLTDLGFSVSGTDNADSYVYTETLIVYKYDEYLSAAQTVLEALGFGRVVDGGDYYTFSTDVLVVVGYDYSPSS